MSDDFKERQLVRRIIAVQIADRRYPNSELDAMLKRAAQIEQWLGRIGG